MQEEDDEETVFDQEGLLDRRKKSRWDWQWFQRFVKTVALSLAFFALVGLYWSSNLHHHKMYLFNYMMENKWN